MNEKKARVQRAKAAQESLQKQIRADQERRGLFVQALKDAGLDVISTSVSTMLVNIDALDEWLATQGVQL